MVLEPTHAPVQVYDLVPGVPETALWCYPQWNIGNVLQVSFIQVKKLKWVHIGDETLISCNRK